MGGRNEIMMNLAMGRDGPAAEDDQIVNIRRPRAAGSQAVNEMKARANAALHELSKGQEGALGLATPMLAVNLLQAKQIGLQRRQHGPQHACPGLEPAGVGWGEVEAFQVDGGEAQGHRW